MRSLVVIYGAVWWLALASFPAYGSPPGDGWTLAWSDEFSGTVLDTSKWFSFTGTNQGGYQDGGSPTVVVSGGHLVITTWTNSSSGVHHTGWISSQNGFQEAYGYWEASIRFNESSGEWSAFWLQPDTINTVTSPADPATNGTEVDIVEHRRRDSSGTDLSNKADINLHWNGYGSSEVNGGPGTVSNPGSTSLQGNWHTYGVMWNPGGYTIYIDGTAVSTVTSGISMRKQFVYLSTFVNGSSWAGPIPSGGYGTAAASSTKMEVDYVRFYQRAERVINGDFEARLAPFTAYNGSSWGASYGRGGSDASRMPTTSSSLAALEQTVYGLRPNTDYVATGWGQVVSGPTGTSVQIGAKSYGGSQVTSSVASAGYTQAATLFTTGASNTTANIFARVPTNGGIGHIDDVDIYRAGNATFGDFENSTFAVWDSYGSSSVSTANSFGGTYSAKFPSGTNADSGIEQNVFGLQPNTNYRLSAWTTNGSYGLFLGVKNYGGADTSTRVYSSSWTRGTVDFTTDAASTSARIYAYRPASADAVTMYADDFFVYEPLTAPWMDQDVGAFTLKGAAGRRGTKFVQQASGSDIWGTSDHFHFTYQTLQGDCQITAQVRTLDNTNVNAKVGVMMRSTVDSYTPEVMVNFTPDNRVQLVRRTASSASSSSDSVSVSAAPWVRLTRRGNLFTGYYSTDGVNWAQVGQSQTIAMPDTVCVGIPACSHDETEFAEAIVDNVSAISLPPAVTLARPAKSAFTVIGAPANLHLTGSVADDGLHGALNVQGWSLASGPVNVTFSNTNSADATVNFPQTGTYVLQLSAANSAGTGVAQLTVTVAPAADPSLPLWMKLNESSGPTALDSSGNSYNGNVIGSVTWQALTGGVFAGGAQFNGTNGYIEVPDAPTLDNTSAFTLAYWFRADMINGAGLVSKRTSISDNNAYTTFLQTDGKLNVDIDGSGDRFTSNTVFTTGTVYHIALVFDGSLPAAQRASLYVNGVLDKTAAETSASIPDCTSTLKVGVASLPTTTFFWGMIDDIHFYRRALKAGEVAALGGYAPTVSCGAAPTVVAGTAVPLTGTASSETTGALSTIWSKTSGPGAATFANASNVATSVTFDQPGTYVLRLTGINSDAEAFNEITLNVGADPNSFAGWVNSSYPGVADPNIIGMQADPESDGVTNLIEFALGMDPTKNDAAPWTQGKPGLPVRAWQDVGGVKYLSLQVRRPIGRIGITYGAEAGGDISNWNAAVQEGTPTANGDGTETVIYRDTQPQGQSARRFIRLKITQP